MIKIMLQCKGYYETEVARFANENWAKLFNANKIMELYNGDHSDGTLRLVFKGKERKNL